MAEGDGDALAPASSAAAAPKKRARKVGRCNLRSKQSVGAALDSSATLVTRIGSDYTCWHTSASRMLSTARTLLAQSRTLYDAAQGVQRLPGNVPPVNCDTEMQNSCTASSSAKLAIGNFVAERSASQSPSHTGETLAAMPDFSFNDEHAMHADKRNVKPEAVQSVCNHTKDESETKDKLATAAPECQSLHFATEIKNTEHTSTPNSSATRYQMLFDKHCDSKWVAVSVDRGIASYITKYRLTLVLANLTNGSTELFALDMISPRSTYRRRVPQSLYSLQPQVVSPHLVSAMALTVKLSADSNCRTADSKSIASPLNSNSVDDQLFTMLHKAAWAAKLGRYMTKHERPLISAVPSAPNTTLLSNNGHFSEYPLPSHYIAKPNATHIVLPRPFSAGAHGQPATNTAYEMRKMSKLGSVQNFRKILPHGHVEAIPTTPELRLCELDLLYLNLFLQRTKNKVYLNRDSQSNEILDITDGLHCPYNADLCTLSDVCFVDHSGISVTLASMRLNAACIAITVAPIGSVNEIVLTTSNVNAQFFGNDLRRKAYFYVSEISCTFDSDNYPTYWIHTLPTACIKVSPAPACSLCNWKSLEKTTALVLNLLRFMARNFQFKTRRNTSPELMFEKFAKFSLLPSVKQFYDAAHNFADYICRNLLANASEDVANSDIFKLFFDYVNSNCNLEQQRVYQKASEVDQSVACMKPKFGSKWIVSMQNYGEAAAHCTDLQNAASNTTASNGTSYTNRSIIFYPYVAKASTGTEMSGGTTEKLLKEDNVHSLILKRPADAIEFNTEAVAQLVDGNQRDRNVIPMGLQGQNAALDLALAQADNVANRLEALLSQFPAHLNIAQLSFLTLPSDIEGQTKLHSNMQQLLILYNADKSTTLLEHLEHVYNRQFYLTTFRVAGRIANAIVELSAENQAYEQAGQIIDLLMNKLHYASMAEFIAIVRRLYPDILLNLICHGVPNLPTSPFVIALRQSISMSAVVQQTDINLMPLLNDNAEVRKCLKLKLPRFGASKLNTANGKASECRLHSSKAQESTDCTLERRENNTGSDTPVSNSLTQQPITEDSTAKGPNSINVAVETKRLSVEATGNCAQSPEIALTAEAHDSSKLLPQSKHLPVEYNLACCDTDVGDMRHATDEAEQADEIGQGIATESENDEKIADEASLGAASAPMASEAVVPTAVAIPSKDYLDAFNRSIKCLVRTEPESPRFLLPFVAELPAPRPGDSEARCPFCGITVYKKSRLSNMRLKLASHVESYHCSSASISVDASQAELYDLANMSQERVEAESVIFQWPSRYEEMKLVHSVCLDMPPRLSMLPYQGLRIGEALRNVEPFIDLSQLELPSRSSTPSSSVHEPEEKDCVTIMQAISSMTPIGDADISEDAQPSPLDLNQNTIDVLQVVEPDVNSPVAISAEPVLCIEPIAQNTELVMDSEKADCTVREIQQESQNAEAKNDTTAESVDALHGTIMKLSELTLPQIVRRVQTVQPVHSAKLNGRMPLYIVEESAGSTLSRLKVVDRKSSKRVPIAHNVDSTAKSGGTDSPNRKAQSDAHLYAARCFKSPARFENRLVSRFRADHVQSTSSDRPYSMHRPLHTPRLGREYTRAFGDMTGSRKRPATLPTERLRESATELASSLYHDATERAPSTLGPVDRIGKHKSEGHSRSKKLRYLYKS